MLQDMSVSNRIGVRKDEGVENLVDEFHFHLYLRGCDKINDGYRIQFIPLILSCV